MNVVNLRGRSWGRALALSVGSLACAVGGGSSSTDSSGQGSGDGPSVASEGVDDGDATTARPPEQGWHPSLELDDDGGAVFSVWGSDTTSVYAVAGQPLGAGVSRGSIYHWDAQQWAMQPAPVDVPGLNWVFGIDAWRFVVGELGTILVREGDQGEWSTYGCETVLPLWGVWGAAPDDVWAVGGDGFNRDPIACHFDGESWTQWSFSNLSIKSHALYKVWGTDSDDVWAVGDAGLLMHWQGASAGWSEVPSGTEYDLISLWGVGPDEILAVGGRTVGVLSRWNGIQWDAQEVPELAGLNGVWMAPDGTSTVVGPMGGMGVVASGSLAVELESSGTALALHAVFGLEGGDLRWAAGGSLDMAPPYVGVILQQAR